MYEGNNGYVALIADVDVDMVSGRVQPRKFVAALDCGPISNPDGLHNQSEGGILQGMSRALVEESHGTTSELSRRIGRATRVRTSALSCPRWRSSC